MEACLGDGRADRTALFAELVWERSFQPQHLSPRPGGSDHFTTRPLRGGPKWTTLHRYAAATGVLMLSAILGAHFALNRLLTRAAHWRSFRTARVSKRFKLPTNSLRLR